MPLADMLRAQFDTVSFERQRPLIVSDADEVLFFFVRGFEKFLARCGFRFDWGRYGLYDNIRRQADNAGIERDLAKSLLATFFEQHTDDLEPVPGAAESLAALAEKAQIVILSNLPFAQRDARLRALKRYGMDYPLVIGDGPKGEMLHFMAEQIEAPIYFIDDIMMHHTSVRRITDRVTTIHFVADSRLRRLISESGDCDRQVSSWPELQNFVASELSRHGY